MKRLKKLLTFSLLESVLFTNSVPTQAKSRLPSGVENEVIGERIEVFVEAHKETTAGM